VADVGDSAPFGGEGRDSLLTRIQVFGGFSTAWVTPGTGIAFLITAFRAGQRNPADIQLLNDASFLIFNMTFMFTLFQQIAAGIAWLQADRDLSVIPRWVAYPSFWVPATYFVVRLIPFIQHGPFTWHGLITFYTTLSLFFLWMTVVSWYVIRAIKQHPEIADHNSRSQQPLATPWREQRHGLVAIVGGLRDRRRPNSCCSTPSAADGDRLSPRSRRHDSALDPSSRAWPV
jgi:hypothetical protein